ncbi:hypothetical protein CEUSTIGMA_g5037.t1 [Chlamydomonas eustigma]|uniref:Cyclin C-terminal domain-containing protein n=1 Tax=Chlamydomonas eustigma TaxID=1157962 RepID=A0A250X3D7_9CHLO|nr:hypothetical protein CEUSTIGMA_g5037.t1 [Chlamydomonas eustigma]|eukprot:GAX77593.1 hypothetical protein CEUSTIGMA_g5037.t1 [Chlamydomonas eustigma]
MPPLGFQAAGQPSTVHYNEDENMRGPSSIIADNQLLDHIKGTEVLTGQAYYTAKASLLSQEQQILRVLQFRLNLVEQPYTYMFSILKTIQASSALVQSSVCVMNDVGTFSAMFLDYPALHLAAACIHVASYLSLTTELGDGIDVPEEKICTSRSSFKDLANAEQPYVADRPPKISWFEALGVRDVDVENLGHAVLNVLMNEPVNKIVRGIPE